MNEFKLPIKFNWQTASNKLVKKYVADLYQSGPDTSPVATELFNNTGVAFTYEYLSPGIYIVISNKPIFSGCGMGCPQGQNTQITISNGTYNAGTYGWSIISFPVSNNAIIIFTSDPYSLSGSNNNILGNYVQNAIEITIYP